jgi:hypothetical protein
MKPILVLALGLTGLLAAACQKPVDAPEVRGVCYQVLEKKGAAPTFHAVAKDQPNMESCAAELDAVRYRFMGLGSPRHDITGLYNNTYLFLDDGGMSTSQSLDGGRFTAFGRDPDGRLTIPAYIRQPGPDGGAITITQDPKATPHPAVPAKK